jgi:hypothetical protein
MTLRSSEIVNGDEAAVRSLMNAKKGGPNDRFRTGQILVQPVSVSVGSSVMAPFLLYVVTALYLSETSS